MGTRLIASLLHLKAACMRFGAISALICFAFTLALGLEVTDSVSYDALQLTCPRKTAWVHYSTTNNCRALPIPGYYDLCDSCRKIYLELNWPYFLKKPKLLQGLACDSSVATLTLTDNTGSVWNKDYVFYKVDFPLPDSVTRQWQSSEEYQNLSHLPPRYNVVFKIMDDKDGKDLTPTSKISIYTRNGLSDRSKKNVINRCRQLFGSRLFAALTKEISESLGSAYSPGVYKVDIFNDGYFPLHKDLLVNRNQLFVLRLKKIPAHSHREPLVK